MNTRLRLMSVASLLLIAVTGCNAPSATLSDEKLTHEEIRSIQEGTDFPRHYNNAIIYDSNKMLLSYSSSDGCIDHPESVAVEGNHLKVTFSETGPNRICKTAVAGPHNKVITMRNGFVPETDYKVTFILDTGAREVPVVVNYSS